MFNFRDRLAQSKNKITDVAGRIRNAARSAEIAEMMDSEEIKERLGDLEAAAEMLDEAVDAEIDEGLASAEGRISAVRENARLAGEKLRSKISSATIRAQMNVNAAREKIADKRDAADQEKAAQRIMDLLDYADECQDLAANASAEAERAMLEAAQEAIAYRKKYGDPAGEE